jgi:manganese-dependent inorganic pyrophosphatase
MPEVFVIGHKNPDTDSACAAYCYASLKTAIGKKTIYTPAVCGVLQPQTKFVFTHAKVTPPRYISNIRPTVADVARNDGMRFDINDPVYVAMKELDEHTISVVPVFSGGDHFEGTFGIHEVARYFMSGGGEERPSYLFREANIERIIPGYYHKRGTDQEFISRIMIGAMNYESSIRRISGLLPEKPVLVIGQRERIIAYAVEHQFPAIILTGIQDKSEITIDFTHFHGSVYVSRQDTAETIRLLRLSVPIKHIMNNSPLSLPHDDLFDDAKKILLTSEHRGLPVLNGRKFEGIVTRRSFIEKPRRKLILVDHNEISQGIPGAEDADILEIIDHHRLAPERTSKPIYVYAKPVGATCTIVYSHYRMHGVPVAKETALLLLAGILSDTLILKSPTTTDEDRQSALELASLAQTDIAAYGSLLLSQMTVLKNADPARLVNADLKVYTESYCTVGISQVEVGSLDDIAECSDGLIMALNDLKKERSLGWALLLITDVIRGHSILITTGHPKAEKELIYSRTGEHTFDLPGVLSRKKQLLPEIFRVLESVY